MNKPRLLSLAALALGFFTPLLPAAVGPFDTSADIGAVKTPGSATFDNSTGALTLVASGTNMWGDHDEFHFAHKKIKGDFILQAFAAFVAEGIDPHRKMGLMARQSLDPKSPHVNIALHGDGLVSLQFRRTWGGPTEEIRLPIPLAGALQVERRLQTFRVSAAKPGDTYTSREIADIDLGDEIYVGTFLCAHNNDVSEKGILNNVRLIKPARVGFVPYREYIGSDLEMLDTVNGQRTILHHEKDSLQAPNWTPDGKALICNRNGRIYRFDLEKRAMIEVNTGEQIQNNNDHALSYDGKYIGLSSGQPSTVYTVPIEGGSPKKITQTNPSYFHGWSPDGKFLLFTGGRNDNYDIYRIPSAGGEEVRLTTTPGLDDGSEYSPDGKYIYFNSERSGRMQIWRMNADGSGQTQLTHDDFNNWFAHPSPDGKWLVILSYGPEIPSGDHPFYKHVYLRLLPIAGGDPKVLAYLYGGQGSINVNSWSPDSRHLAFVSNTDSF